MKRWTIAMMCIAACSAAGDAVQNGAAPDPADTVVMEGIHLQFHEEGPTFGEARPPSFRMDAARGEWAESSRQWNVQNAEAVIYREGADDLLLSAARGFCDLETRVAQLSDGVRLTAGAFVVDVLNLHYDNGTGIATSTARAQLTNGENRMSGNDLFMDTRNDGLELTDGEGTIKLAAVEQTDTKEVAGAERESRFESLDVKNDGKVKFNFNTGQVEEINDNVVLTVKGVDPADNLTVKAQRVRFEYATEEDKNPSAIELTGGVQLEHAKVKGTASRVVVNFDSGDVQFEGNAELTSDVFEGARSENITFNLYSGDAVLGPGGGTISGIKLNRDADAPEPAKATAQRS